MSLLPLDLRPKFKDAQGSQISVSLSPEGWDTTETPHRSPTTPRLGFSFNSATHTGEIYLSSAFDVAEEGNEIHKLQPSFSSKVLSSS